MDYMLYFQIIHKMENNNTTSSDNKLTKYSPLSAVRTQYSPVRNEQLTPRKNCIFAYFS